MSTPEERLDAVATATALIAEAVAVLAAAEVRNTRVLNAVDRARAECATHERELMHVQARDNERDRECRRSASS